MISTCNPQSVSYASCGFSRASMSSLSQGTDFPIDDLDTTSTTLYVESPENLTPVQQDQIRTEVENQINAQGGTVISHQWNPVVSPVLGVTAAVAGLTLVVIGIAVTSVVVFWAGVVVLVLAALVGLAATIIGYLTEFGQQKAGAMKEAGEMQAEFVRVATESCAGSSDPDCVIKLVQVLQEGLKQSQKETGFAAGLKALTKFLIVAGIILVGGYVIYRFMPAKRQ